MATQNNRVVLVCGATGKQGGAVARELLKKGFRVRAMTRKPESAEARAISGLGAEVVQADLDDAASLERALDSVWGVFSVQNTWEAGVEKEEEQGKRMAKVARKRGVQHFVYTSVGSAHRNTGIPHFENKWRIEGAVRGVGFPSYAILRPVFFMENLLAPWFLQGDKLVTALNPNTKLQMIAVEDIGKVGAQLFERASEMNGQAIDLAGDSVTLPEAARMLGEALGKRIDYAQIPLDEVRKNSVDMAMMLDWFDRVGYDADIAAVERQFDTRLLRFPEWVKKQANLK
jgi:uncharacterized protein YbjT (DUF2867 family)